MMVVVDRNLDFDSLNQQPKMVARMGLLMDLIGVIPSELKMVKMMVTTVF